MKKIVMIICFKILFLYICVLFSFLVMIFFWSFVGWNFLSLFWLNCSYSNCLLSMFWKYWVCFMLVFSFWLRFSVYSFSLLYLVWIFFVLFCRFCFFFEGGMDFNVLLYCLRRFLIFVLWFTRFLYRICKIFNKWLRIIY